MGPSSGRVEAVREEEGALTACSSGLLSWVLSVAVAPGVRYLEAKMHGGAPFGAKILSAVRNREASASRRLLMYYSYGSFNP